MKPPGKSHHAAEVPLIKRHREGDVWVYEDAQEAFASGEFPLFHDFDLVAFDDWLGGPGWTEKPLQAALDLRRKVIQAYAAGNDEAIELGVMLLGFVQKMNAREAIALPLARHGKKFPGRKKGSVSPLRKAVRRVLLRTQDANPREVWTEIKKKAPRGMELHERSRSNWPVTTHSHADTKDWYVTTHGWPNTGFPRFANIVAEERKKLPR
jgi:hypothetical protein